LVLTGGAAQLAGAARLGREVLQMPVRVAGPTGVSGLTDHLLTPAYSTSLGLLIWGAQTVHGDESRSYESAPGPGMLGRMRDWARGLLP
jgi:cell division protein FtsA